MIKKKKNFIIYLNQFFNNKSIYRRREEKRRKKVRNIHNILPLPPKKEKNVNSITFKRIKLHETSTSVHRLANVWLTCHALAYTSISLSWLVYASISAWFSGRRVQVRDPERGQILTSSNVTIVLIVQCRFEETLSVGHPDLEPRAPPRASRGRFENSRFSSLGEMYNRCWRRVYYCRWSARNSSPPPPSSFSLHLFQLPLSSIPHLLWFLDRLMIYIYIFKGCFVPVCFTSFFSSSSSSFSSLRIIYFRDKSMMLHDRNSFVK